MFCLGAAYQQAKDDCVWAKTKFFEKQIRRYPPVMRFFDNIFDTNSYDK